MLCKDGGLNEKTFYQVTDETLKLVPSFSIFRRFCFVWEILSLTSLDQCLIKLGGNSIFKYFYYEITLIVQFQCYFN